MENMATRRYAHPFDRLVKGDETNHGVSPSSNAIGGYYGIGWYDYFIDHKSGEHFRVHCSDGVYGGKDAYPDHVLKWMEKQYQAIKKRTIAEVEAGAVEVRIATPEWHIMLTRVHVGWLDGPDVPNGCEYRLINEGRIGTCRGVPVIVDTKMANHLGEPPA